MRALLDSVGKGWRNARWGFAVCVAIGGGCAEGASVGEANRYEPVATEASAPAEDAAAAPCGSGEKVCNGQCVLVAAVVTGCANTPCLPCPSAPGQQAYCDAAGSCALQCLGPGCLPGSGGGVATGATGGVGGGVVDAGLATGGVAPSVGGMMASGGGGPPPGGSGSGGLNPPDAAADGRTGGASGAGGTAGGSGEAGGGAGGGDGGAGGVTDACPGYPTTSGCAECICERCSTEIAGCVASGETEKDVDCLAIRQCFDQNQCTGSPCYCGDSPTCSPPGGPCVAVVDAASGNASLADLQSQQQDPSTAVGRSALVSECALANCAVECGYP